MSLFVIGDPHLSFQCNKPMDVFSGWSDYVERLEKNWRAVVNDEDYVVLAGDISWGMNMEEALSDFQFLNSLPGTKLILKGNHDYWWATRKKMEAFFAAHELNTLQIVHNSACRVGPVSVCGTRGWFYDAGPLDQKVLLREAGRLRTSIQSAKELGGECIVFLHYPPVTADRVCDVIFDVLREGAVKRCYYGHLHGPSCNWAVQGAYDGIDFRLISADFLQFCPKLVEKF